MMKAIVLMAIGEKYLMRLKYVKAQFKSYAKKCNATLVVCT
jgi:hypothetical protein